ncbi:hypothetical protein PLUA15_40085 [Pseudomonas lundensis]|uniref:Uncharacterized protein n=1 Tax=Pseudomonas lundensis TaxID=86185 RepID=A0AAX2HBL3_9PSED|nr:hypothetical protein PLUA15_40085 [Pseudomonas lundensis]
MRHPPGRLQLAAQRLFTRADRERQWREHSICTLNCVLFLELSGTTCVFLENILFFYMTRPLKMVVERRD